MKVWVFLLLLGCVTPVSLGQENETSEQSIDEVERREGKPQDNGNGKDTFECFFGEVYVEIGQFERMEIASKSSQNPFKIELKSSQNPFKIQLKFS